MKEVFYIRNRNFYYSENEIIEDKYKKQLALDNGIKPENYIVIDARYSKLDWIRENILHSKLNKIFSLELVNWIECGEFALSNIAISVCNYKRDFPEKSCRQIAKYFKLSPSVISKYLNQYNIITQANTEVSC